MPYRSATTLRRVQMLTPSHSTSIGLPTARRIRASLSTRLRRLLAVGVEHHQPPHGVDRIDDADVGPQPVAVDGEEERARLLAACASSRSGRAEEQMHRMAEHALPGQPDAELAADRLCAPSQPTR